jgi:Mg/Co/Ni transporter MgtE
MEEESSIEIRELMEYEDDLIGSLMTTDFISCTTKSTIKQGISDQSNL